MRPPHGAKRNKHKFAIVVQINGRWHWFCHYTLHQRYTHTVTEQLQLIQEGRWETFGVSRGWV